MSERTPEQEYADGRIAAVICHDHGGPEHPNCRHAWNAAHPDDPVTAEEQQAFEDRMTADLERQDCDPTYRAEIEAKYAWLRTRWG